MANWKSNPIVGLVAVVLIAAAGYLIYRQVSGGPDPIGRMKPHRIYQAQIMALETVKLQPNGEVVLICGSDPTSDDYIEGFKSKAGGMAVQTFRVSPETEGNAAITPGFEGIVAMLGALKKHPNAKCLVNFVSVTYDGSTGPEAGLPRQVADFFQKGGKAVMLSGGTMLMPGQKDPFLELVKKGQVTMVANRPAAAQPVVKPFSLAPREYFDAFMTVVAKDNEKAYEEALRKASEPQPEEQAPTRK